MLGEKPGWYRDPAPPNPGSPSTLRWWDGTNWTTQVKPAPKAVRQAWQAEAAAQRAGWAAQQAEQAQQAAGSTMVASPPGQAVWQGTRDFTPDGQRVAGWGRRFAATILDNIAVQVLTLVAGWHYLHQMVVSMQTWGQEYAASQGAGAAAAQPVPSPMSAVMGPLLMFVAIGFAVRFVYGVGFLKAFSATPGKMLLGMEVRLREAPGPLSWGTVLVRWLVQNAASLVSLVPFASLVAWVFPLLDGLWPLWDGKRQALHDKAAGTNVVLTR